MARTDTKLVAIAVAAAVATACGTSPTPSRLGSAPPTRPTPSPASPATPSASAVAQIEQPVPPPGVDIAPDDARVDLAMPTFSNPTQVTNPLFPVSSQASVLMLGHVDDKPFRTEVTLLPYTRVIDWNGQRVETLVSQYVAYLDGRIQEVAYDYYAQADDGSVWYFGEDVADFVDGAIVTTEGTWLAGKDGPAAMIMPGVPTVGDVYRTENAPGLVFEQVTVQSVDETLAGPLGPVPGGLRARELHDDGTTEDKLFAPGYGEFSTTDGVDLEALALAVPTDALTTPVPTALTAITTGTVDVAVSIDSGDWAAAASSVEEIRAAWQAFDPSEAPKQVPPIMDTALDALSSAVDARDAATALNAALDVRQSSLDLELRHRPVIDVDTARFRLWTERLILDAAAESTADAGADIFALDYIRDRIIETFGPSTRTALNTSLGDLQIATVDGDFEAMAEAAAALREVIPAG